MRARCGILLAVSAGMVWAQADGWQPEVRRAIPVSTPSPTPNEPPVAPAVPFENPAWMDRVQPAPPAPVPAEPQTEPFRPKGRIEVSPAPTPEPGAEGEIRIAPGGENAAQAALDAANSIYARKMYDYAIVEYEKFLVTYSAAPGRDMALFRLGECHRMLGNVEAARSAYERLLQEIRTGEFAGAGAFRLGEYLYAGKQFDPALMQFQLAAAQAASEEVRLTAQYHAARCLDHLGRPQEAIASYEAVAAVEKNNPYRDYARLALAGAAMAAGQKDKALAQYVKIAAGAAPSAIRAEATVKAAAIEAESGDKKAALKHFEAVRKMSDAGEWNTAAYLGAMRLSYDLGDYKKVTSLATKPPAGLPPEAQAETLLMSGNAYRQLGNARAARAVYDRLVLKFPEAASTQNARFHRLVTMYQLDDPKVIEEADEFLKHATDPRERAQVALLKAEALFKAKKFAEAAPVYSQVLGSQLDGELKTKALYKLGFCQLQSGDAAAATRTFSEYIEKNPTSSTLAAAIVQRGLARQQSKDYAGALEDFELVLDKYPGNEREFALQQKALILGQQQDYKGMTAAFRTLLDEFPKTSGAAQANFWIGWAAFEEKDYAAAIKSLEAASKLDPDQYGERAALRIILCQYYLEDRPALLRTIAAHKDVGVPVEITRWLGRKSFEEGDFAAAEQFLLPAADDPKNPDAQVFIELAEAQIRLGKTQAAAPHVAKYLETAREPYSRARGLLAQAGIALGRREFDEARKLTEEALLLQPEGRLNAEGRLLMGEISFAAGDFDGAARAFMTVAVLYDDVGITPRALRRAADSYRKANNLLEAEKAMRELKERFPDKPPSPKLSQGTR